MIALDLIKPTYASIAASATDGKLKDALKLVSPEDIAKLFAEDDVPDDSDIDVDVLKDIIYEMAQGRYHELDDNDGGDNDVDITVTETDVNDDGDVDEVTVDANGDGNVDMGATSTDDDEEKDALDKLDEAADTAAKENPISIDKVDAMADEAAEDNEYSLDKVDAMADADAARLDSTGNKSYEDKLTPEQKKLEALALSDKRKKRVENMKSNWGKTATQKKNECAGNKETDNTQKNILAALQDRLL